MYPQGSKVDVFVLNLHADFECHRTGACCTAGWDIPIEPAQFAMASGILSSKGFMTEATPDGVAAIIRRDASGACIFFDSSGDRACTLHRCGGHASMPTACQLFPRVALLDTRGIRVTLSHFCPTVAQTLLRRDIDAVGVIANPEPFARRSTWEGFDARMTIPPLVRPGLVADLDVASLWEELAVELFGSGQLMPEAAITRLAAAAERLRGWKPSGGTLADLGRRVFDDARGGGLAASTPLGAADAVRWYERVTAFVPDGLSRPALPSHFADVHAARVAPAWASLRQPIGRYLAAKAFASWSAYCGEGFRTQLAMVVAAFGVLHVEAARVAVRAGRTLDETLFIEAARQADLLLVHQASHDALARQVSRVERLSAEAFLHELGLGH